MIIKIKKKENLILKELEAVETPNPMTAVFRLANPAPYLMMSLSANNIPVICKKVFEGTVPLQNPTANRPIGTGPYKFGAWERGQFIRLDRNDRYWKPGLPLLNRIIARFIPDAATRSAALEAGEAHYAAYSAVNAADIRRMQANPILGSTTLGYGTTAATSVLEFNMRRPILAKKEVRQAIGHAIDYDGILGNLLGGAALRYNDAEELTRLIDGFDAEAHRARAREYERLYDAAGPEAVMFAFVKAFQPDRPAKC